MEIIEQIWAWVQANPAMVLNGVGGGVLGPMVSKLLRGGTGTGFLGGILGGIGAGYGADMTGLNEVVANNLEMIKNVDIVSYLQNLVEGAVGGGGIGGILGALLKRR